MVAVAEHATEERTRQLARLLDSRFRIPGTQVRFGVDSVIGLVPGVGDAAGLALSSYVILQAVGLGARGATVARMVANVAIDAVFGSVPLLGSLFDLWFKANDRNVALLARHGTDPAGTADWSRRSLRRTVVAVVAGTLLLVVGLLGLVGWAVSRLV